MQELFMFSFLDMLPPPPPSLSLSLSLPPSLPPPLSPHSLSLFPPSLPPLPPSSILPSLAKSKSCSWPTVLIIKPSTVSVVWVKRRGQNTNSQLTVLMHINEYKLSPKPCVMTMACHSATQERAVPVDKTNACCLWDCSPCGNGQRKPLTRSCGCCSLQVAGAIIVICTILHSTNFHLNVHARTFTPPRWPCGLGVRLDRRRSRVRISLAQGFFRGRVIPVT